MEPAWLRDRLYSWGHMTTTFQIIILSKHSTVPAAAASEKPARQTCFKPLKPEHADHEAHANSQSTDSARGFTPPRKDPSSSSSHAFQQVGVAVVSSAAVAQLPDARPKLHGAAVAQTTLRQRNHLQTEPLVKLKHWTQQFAFLF